MLYLQFQLPYPIDMDPTTAAGLGLAALSLTAQCFTGTMQGI